MGVINQLVTGGPHIAGGAYLGFGLQYALLTPFVLELGVPVRWASIIWLGGPITGAAVASKFPKDPAVFKNNCPPMHNVIFRDFKKEMHNKLKAHEKIKTDKETIETYRYRNEIKE